MYLTALGKWFSSEASPSSREREKINGQQKPYFSIIVKHSTGTIMTKYFLATRIKSWKYLSIYTNSQRRKLQETDERVALETHKQKENHSRNI